MRGEVFTGEEGVEKILDQEDVCDNGALMLLNDNIRGTIKSSYVAPVHQNIYHVCIMIN